MSPSSESDEMSGLVAASLADERFRTMLISVFAGLAALASRPWACTALPPRRRAVARAKMAIRAALGATNGSIARLIVGAGAGGVVSLASLVAGVGLALIGTRVLTPYLYAIGTTDFATYGAVLTSARRHHPCRDVGAGAPGDARPAGRHTPKGMIASA
jgi:hypothetical protein